jgi:hypothetical protein
MSKNIIWRRLLIAVLVVVLLFSLLYTLKLVRSVSAREKENARIWINTIKQQRKLISNIEMLFDELDDEEEKKLRLWAKAVKRLPLISHDDSDFQLVFDLVKDNESIPAILTDRRGEVLYSRNIEQSYRDLQLNEVLALMKKEHHPIRINLPNRGLNYLYYSESKIHRDVNIIFDDLLHSYLFDIENNVVSSPVLYMDSSQKEVLAYGNLSKNSKLLSHDNTLQEQITALQNSVTPLQIGNEFLFVEETDLLLMIKFFPVVFIVLVCCFVIVFYFYLSTSGRYERNFLWVGMSKETAHQLGTPISSMMAWIEVLKDEYGKEIGFQEIQKDVDRLELIADRFSKIGSRPKLEEGEINTEVSYVLSYMKPRISPHVKISISDNSADLPVLYSKQLFGWVLENLIKNAVDAMSGKGELDIELFKEKDKVIIEIEDTGTGIRKSRFKKVFKAGYSSKKRGWGLGLTLVKRIIEEYHQGKIFVKSSVEGKGTVMRMELILLKK